MCFKSAQSSQMDLIFLSFSVSVLMVCLPGAASSSSADNKSCLCPDIPQSKTRQEACFQTGSTYSYTCVQGDVRSLRCKENEGAAQWTKYLLECILNDCPCPEIPQWSLTKPPPQTCFHIGSRFRYQCKDGYSRKPGTSNLIKCEATGGAPQWTEPTLECISTSIRDVKQNVSILSSVTEERNTTESTRRVNGCPCPEIPQWSLTKPPPQTCFHIGDRFRYQCKDGYSRKPGTSNLIKCEATGGAPQWTEPTLECIYNNSCPCPENPQRNFTKSPPTACFQISSNYSYTCKEFYMKKMGTSNFMKCKHIDGVPRGAEYRLECIPTSTTEMMPSASASPSVTGERKSTEAITHDSVKAATVGAVSTVLRLMSCSLIGIVLIVYKRKLIKDVPVQTADSVRPVNPGPSGLDL